MEIDWPFKIYNLSYFIFLSRYLLPSGQNRAGAMGINNWRFLYYCYCYHYWYLVFFLYRNCFIRFFWAGWGHSGRNEEEKKGMQRSWHSRWTKLKFPNLGIHPGSFLDVCLLEYVFSQYLIEFFTLEPNIYRTWGNWNWKTAEGQNYWTWSFHLYLSVILHNTPSLVLFFSLWFPW